jgi:hypothetical protein
MAAGDGNDGGLHSRRLFKRSFFSKAAANVGEVVRDFGWDCHDNLFFHPGLPLTLLGLWSDRLDISSFLDSF